MDGDPDCFRAHKAAQKQAGLSYLDHVSPTPHTATILLRFILAPLQALLLKQCSRRLRGRTSNGRALLPAPR